jgi:hypothetical protein
MPEKIQISEQTHQLLATYYQEFHMEYRGQVEIKVGN